jgi:hypothetical protein
MGVNHNNTSWVPEVGACAAHEAGCRSIQNSKQINKKQAQEETHTLKELVMIMNYTLSVQRYVI